MPNKADPQVILNKIDMLIDKLKPSVKHNSSSSSTNYSSLSTTSSNLSDSLSSVKNNSSKLVLAQVDSGNIDSMTHSIVENVLEHFDTKLPSLLNEVNSPSDSLKDHQNVNVVIVGINDEDLNSVYSNHNRPSIILNNLSQSSTPTETSNKNSYNIQASDSTSVILGGSNSIPNAVTKSTTTVKSTSIKTTTPKTTTTTTLFTFICFVLMSS